MKKNNTKIGVIGLWHLGSVYSAGLSTLGFDVTGFDFDKNVVENLQKNIPPLFEPQLEETIVKHNKKNLFFTSNFDELVNGKDYIFITFDLPVNDKDQVDVSLVDKTYVELSKYDLKKTIVVISSQVPLGTCRKLVELFVKKKKQIGGVICFPENLRLGKAFESFLKPDRIIVGADCEKTAKKFVNDFEVLKCQKIEMSLESAEMVKHALNSYLATCVSFSSEISDICELYGANMNAVVSALKTDRRVSPYAPINPGLGFAGGTLGRDIQSLKRLSKEKGYKPKLLSSVYEVNSDRLESVLKKIKRFHKNISRKKIGILGLTYKPGTNTLRRSMSLSLAEVLHREKAYLIAYDPVITETIQKYEYITISKKLNEFFKDLDLVVLMTEWPEFKGIQFKKFGNTMKRKIIIDTKNFFDKKELEKLGFEYKGVGI